MTESEALLSFQAFTGISPDPIDHRNMLDEETEYILEAESAIHEPDWEQAARESLQRTFPARLKEEYGRVRVSLLSNRRQPGAAEIEAKAKETLIGRLEGDVARIVGKRRADERRRREDDARTQAEKNLEFWAKESTAIGFGLTLDSLTRFIASHRRPILWAALAGYKGPIPTTSLTD